MWGGVLVRLAAQQQRRQEAGKGGKRVVGRSAHGALVDRINRTLSRRAQRAATRTAALDDCLVAGRSGLRGSGGVGAGHAGPLENHHAGDSIKHRSYRRRAARIRLPVTPSGPWPVASLCRRSP